MEYLALAYIGSQIFSSFAGARSQSKQNTIARQAAYRQKKELEKMADLEEARLQRENAELMNATTNLTNISWSGANAPSIAFDKYGDLG